MSGAKSPFSIHPHGVRWDNYTKEFQFPLELSTRDFPHICENPSSLQTTY